MNQLQPPWAGLAPVDPYPFEETHDLRSGPDLHRALLAMLPLVGAWRGRGQGGYPTIAGEDGDGQFQFGQEVRFSHDGRPFLFYESRTWIIGAGGVAKRQSFREVGWWRPVMADGEVTDELEVLLSSPTGIQELYLGRVIDTTRYELATDAVVRTSTAKEVNAGHRLYGIVEGALLYAHDMAAVGQPLQAHVSARLERVGG